MESVPQRIPGKLEIAQVYNDSWRGWPVRPHDRQHPIRGSFLDPRPDPELGARTTTASTSRSGTTSPNVEHRREGRIASMRWKAARSFSRHRVVRVATHELVTLDMATSTPWFRRARRSCQGQHIGWTCKGDWHVHLSEFVFASGTPLRVNPLRPGGKLRPYVDTASPEIREIRFYAPAEAELEPSAGHEPCSATSSRYADIS
jgi:hypothetical protein